MLCQQTGSTAVCFLKADTDIDDLVKSHVDFKLLTEACELNTSSPLSCLRIKQTL